MPLMLIVAAGLAWRRGSNMTYTFAGLAALAFILGRMRPQWFRPLYVAGLTLSYPIAWALGYLLLVAVFYLLIAPIGLILRLVRRDPLARHFDREAQSYWVARSESGDRKRYFRQY